MFKNKKVISFLLAFITCCSMTSTVFADTQAMKVSAKRVSSYSVTIPSTLSLTTTDKQNFTGTYTVGVKGDVAANDTVYLRPQNTSFEMVGKADSNNKSIASVTQTKTEWSGSEIDSSSFTETTGDVEAEITHADEYEGDLVFEYGIDTLYCEHNYEDNVCTKCGKEASVGYLYASDGSVIKQFTNADVMKYGSISHFESSLEEPIVISLPKYLGLSDDQINTITKIVMPEMIAPADCSYMFYHCEHVQEIDFTGFDVSSVVNMLCMFAYAGCNATVFNIGDLSQWKVDNVTDMSSMFNCAGRLATTFNIGDLSSWKVSNVANMRFMFNLAGENATYTLNLSSWNVDKVTSYSDFNTGVESKVTPPTWKN